MKKIMLGDFQNLLIRGMSKLPYFSHNGIFTSGLYGLLTQMARYALVHEPDIIFMCNDYPPYKRKEIFPDYKRKANVERTKLDEEFFASLSISRTICMEVLKRLGIPVLMRQGFEADDIMAKVAQVYSPKVEKIIIVSNDSDLYQLLKYRNVYMDKGKTGMYSYTQFKKEYVIEPKDWVNVLSIAGSHNAVPPIKKGIGQKTALKMLSRESKYEELFTSHAKEIELRKNLARLPYEDFELVVEENKKRYTYSNFSVWLRRKYGIEVNLSLDKMFKMLLKEGR